MAKNALRLNVLALAETFWTCSEDPKPIPVLHHSGEEAGNSSDFSLAAALFIPAKAG
jgi:hypothetical protein